MLFSLCSRGGDSCYGGVKLLEHHPQKPLLCDIAVNTRQYAAGLDDRSDASRRSYPQYVSQSKSWDSLGRALNLLNLFHLYFHKLASTCKKSLFIY
jgi:hypothetical protein